MRSEPQGTSLCSGGSRILGYLPVKDWLRFFYGKWRIIWAGFNFSGKHLCK